MKILSGSVALGKVDSPGSFPGVTHEKGVVFDSSFQSPPTVVVNLCGLNCADSPGVILSAIKITHDSFDIQYQVWSSTHHLINVTWIAYGD